MMVSDDDGSSEDEVTVVATGRTELLRYRIECCRSFLRAGAPLAMALWYLAEIQRARAELRMLAERRAAGDTAGGNTEV